MSACLKIRYLTKANARKARGKIGDRRLRPYWCLDCRSWHLGHLPDAIRRGEKTRAEVFGDGA